MTDLFSNKANPTKETVDESLAALRAAMTATGASGLLSPIAAVMASLGAGPQIFSNGSGIMSSNYGARVQTWLHTNETIDDEATQWHDAWDVSANGSTDYVAPFAGTFDLGYSRSGGLSLTTTSQDSSRKLDYMHAAASSIMNYVGLFSTAGVVMNGAGSLGGIAQNMMLGQMGDTGTESTSAHGHVRYQEKDVNTQQWASVNPSALFGANYFGGLGSARITPYARSLSGWDSTASKATYKITTANIIQASYWSQIMYAEAKDRLNFQTFITNPLNTVHFAPDIDWMAVSDAARRRR